MKTLQLVLENNTMALKDADHGNTLLSPPSKSVLYKIINNRVLFFEGSYSNQIGKEKGYNISLIKDDSGTVYTVATIRLWLSTFTGSGGTSSGTGSANPLAAKSTDVVTQTNALSDKIDDLITSDSALSATQVAKLEEMKTADATKREEIRTELVDQGVVLDTLSANLIALSTAETRKAQSEADLLAGQTATTNEVKKLQDKQDLTNATLVAIAGSSDYEKQDNVNIPAFTDTEITATKPIVKIVAKDNSGAFTLLKIVSSTGNKATVNHGVAINPATLFIYTE